MEQRYWQAYFDVSYDAEHLPDWQCPVCYKGILVPDENGIKTFANEAFKRRWKNESIDDFEAHGNFIGVLTCNNHKCIEKIVLSGTFVAMPEPNVVGDEIVAVNHLLPKHLDPPLRVLPFESYIPSIVDEALLKSYAVFWIDASACAGAIRKVVEVIMTERGIPKTTVNKSKKRVNLLLKGRLDKFKLKRPNVAEILEAIKWIGNEGSHEQELLIRNDLWQAYDLLEHALDKLYNPKHKALVKTVKAINKSKGIKRKKHRHKFGIFK